MSESSSEIFNRSDFINPEFNASHRDFLMPVVISFVLVLSCVYATAHVAAPRAAAIHVAAPKAAAIHVAAPKAAAIHVAAPKAAAIHVAAPMVAETPDAGPRMATAHVATREVAAAASVVAPLDSATSQTQKPWALALSLTQTSKVAAQDSSGLDPTSEVFMKLTYNLSRVMFNLSGAIERHSNKEGLTDVSNLRLGIGHQPISLIDGISFSNQIYGRAPTNRVTRERDLFRGAAGIENQIAIQPLGWFIGIHNTLSLSRNFHQYNVNRLGDANIAWNLRDLLGIQLELLQWLAVGVEMDYLAQQTYRDFQRSRIEIGQYLSFHILKNADFKIGHTNAEDLIEATERSSHLGSVSPKSSKIYAQLEILFN